MGLFRGNETLPVERTETAGFMTFSVAPYGYTNVSDLWRIKESVQNAGQKFKFMIHVSPWTLDYK